MTSSQEAEPSAEWESSPRSRVGILDAGAQYSKLIDRQVRGLSIQAEVFPLDTPMEVLIGCDAFILSGGHQSVYAEDAPKPDPRIYESGKPLLGICYGMQLINQAFGGEVKGLDAGEYGPGTRISVRSDSPLFRFMDRTQEVLMSHGDSITKLAPGFREVAWSGGTIAAIADDQRRIYGVQFHPEVYSTKNGQDMMANFLLDIAQLEPNYTLEDRIEKADTYIRETVGEKKVIIFASGGVDSTVLATRVRAALPNNQIRIVHVDIGYMRHKESETVKQALEDLGLEVMLVDAKEQFYSATTFIDGSETPPLHTVTDPEIKRKIIGDTFMKVMERVIEQLDWNPVDVVLAQGTLRPDLIESASRLASSSAAVIKTHHNDSPLARKYRDDGQIVEPLQELHKDEVREIGERLGLPRELVWRQPFPGPGLAIRILCAEQPYITERFDSINNSLLEFSSTDIAAHLLPVRTVGVQGDDRSYNYLAALSGSPDWSRLFDIAKQIPQAIRDINRVVYIFGDKLEGSIHEITPTFPDEQATEQLRLADKHVNEVLRKYGLHESLSQVPVVSFPVHFGKPGYRSIAIRPFMTPDFMTGEAAVPGKNFPEEALAEIVDGVLKIPGISRVAYDLTSKPPGTTEWE